MTETVSVTADYGDGTRSRGLALTGVIGLKTLLLIPHIVVLYFVSIAALVGAWIGYWAIAFTGRQPDGITNLVYGMLKWQNRVNGWSLSLSDDYPPFGFDAPHGVVTEIAEGGRGQRSRGWAVLGILSIKGIAVIIQLFIVAIIGLFAFIGAYFNYWAILFTGRSMQGVHNLVLKVIRANARIVAWVWSLTDEYPPFGIN